jgi:hypothetical protein
LERTTRAWALAGLGRTSRNAAASPLATRSLTAGR